MIIFVNNKSTKFCQVTLHINKFIHKRKVVPFFLRYSVYAKLLTAHLMLYKPKL